MSNNYYPTNRGNDENIPLVDNPGYSSIQVGSHYYYDALTNIDFFGTDYDFPQDKDVEIYFQPPWVTDPATFSITTTPSPNEGYKRITDIQITHGGSGYGYTTDESGVYTDKWSILQNLKPTLRWGNLATNASTSFSTSRFNVHVNNSGVVDYLIMAPYTYPLSPLSAPSLGFVSTVEPLLYVHPSTSTGGQAVFQVIGKTTGFNDSTKRYISDVILVYGGSGYDPTSAPEVDLLYGVSQAVNNAVSSSITDLYSNNVIAQTITVNNLSIVNSFSAPSSARDTTPTQNSTNLMLSGDLYSYFSNIQFLTKWGDWTSADSRRAVPTPDTYGGTAYEFNVVSGQSQYPIVGGSDFWHLHNPYTSQFNLYYYNSTTETFSDPILSIASDTFNASFSNDLAVGGKITWGSLDSTLLDVTPISGSSKLITSGAVYTAIQSVSGGGGGGGGFVPEYDSVPTQGSSNLLTSDALYTAFGTKQDTITSSTDISSRDITSTGLTITNAYHAYPSIQIKDHVNPDNWSFTAQLGYGILILDFPTNRTVANFQVKTKLQVDGPLILNDQSLDTNPVASSTKLLTSGSVYTALGTKQNTITGSTDISCRDLQAKTIHVRDPNGGQHQLKGIHNSQFDTNCVQSSAFVQTFDLPQEYNIDPAGYFDSVATNGDYTLNSGYWPISCTCLYNGATPTNKINQVAVLAFGTNTASAKVTISICFSIPPPN